MTENELLQESDLETKVETHEVVEADKIKPEDIKDEDISDEMIEEFTKSKGKTLKIPKKEVKEAPTEKPAEVKQEVKEEKEPDNEKKVNLGALHEERRRRQELEKKLAEYEAKEKEAQKPKQEIPAFEEDPLENINQRLAAKEKADREAYEEYQRNQQKAQFVNAYAKVAQEFKQTTPDFTDAYQFLINSRVKELSHFGYAPEQINQIIEAEEAGLVSNAFQAGLNPANAVYEMAKLRGYSKPQPPQAQTNNSQKLDTIQKGQNLNKSFSGGKVAGQSLTDEVIDDIDNMNPFENLRGKTTLDILFEKMASGR